MRTFRPWNSSVDQPLSPVAGFAILARDGRIIPVTTIIPEDGARLAEFLATVGK